MSLALDLVRLAAVVLGVVILGMMCLRASRARVIKGDRFTVYATAALVLATGYIIVQESQQIGKPFTFWRLPWLLAVELLTLSALWRSDV